MWVEIFRQTGSFAVKALPWMILGLALAGFIHVFFSARFFRPITGRFKPVLFAAAVGFPLPLCCFGALPVGLEFSRKAKNLGPMFAFIIAAPATSLSAVLVTYAFLGPQFALILIVTVFVAALVTGGLGIFLPVKEEMKVPCPHCIAKKYRNKLTSALHYGFIEMGKEILLYMVIGLFLAGVIAVAVPISVIESTLSAGPLPLVFALAMALAVYICPTGSVPFVAALVEKGMSMGAALVFLVLGPATNYPFILILWRKFGFRALGVYLLGLLICSLGFAFLFGDLVSFN